MGNGKNSQESPGNEIGFRFGGKNVKAEPTQQVGYEISACVRLLDVFHQN